MRAETRNSLRNIVCGIVRMHIVYLRHCILPGHYSFRTLLKKKIIDTTQIIHGLSVEIHTLML